ncbi:Asp23/Gls24 family envelope stress response protein [Micromonospora chersina]|uniref:Asp23/Gls24 family envelope stress response protein n=1 Tax=Micromonospora chersina TaxID=47854 RepID=UPI003C9E8CA4
MTGILPRRATAPPMPAPDGPGPLAPAPDGPGAPAPTPDRPTASAPALAPVPDRSAVHAPVPDRSAAQAPVPDGSDASAAGLVSGRTAWSEERMAGLAEEAARRVRAISEPVATVRADGGAARVDLDVVVAHGVELTAVAGAVRRRVAARIEACTGLTVEAVTVTVVDLRLPAEGATPTDGDHPEGGRRDRCPGPGPDTREAT